MLLVLAIIISIALLDLPLEFYCRRGEFQRFDPVLTINKIYGLIIIFFDTSLNPIALFCCFDVFCAYL
jgi:hypothetical protein